MPDDGGACRGAEVGVSQAGAVQGSEGRPGRHGGGRGGGQGGGGGAAVGQQDTDPGVEASAGLVLVAGVGGDVGDVRQSPHHALSLVGAPTLLLRYSGQPRH